MSSSLRLIIRCNSLSLDLRKHLGLDMLRAILFNDTDITVVWDYEGLQHPIPDELLMNVYERMEDEAKRRDHWRQTEQHEIGIVHWESL